MGWRFFTAALACISLLSGACDDSSDSTRTCGDGTQEIDGECRSPLACGEGAVEQDGVCVPSDESVTCGSGTMRQGDTCVRLSEPVVCGEGTREEDGTCVSTVVTVTCGEGTELDEAGESCVATSPLVCGAGTVEEAGECVSDPCGDGTVEADGACIPIELSDSAALDGLCPKFARNYCESLARCECDVEERPLLARLSVDLDYCAAYVENVTCLNTSLLLTLAVGTGQVVPNVDAINAFADVMIADEACEIDIPTYLKPATVGTYLLDMLSPATGEGEPCNFTAACADSGYVCRFAQADSEERTCLAPAALDEHCTSNTDCQQALFCASASGTCQPRAALTEACSGQIPCGADACCRDSVCVALPAETEACCDNNTCGASDELYCSAGQCVTYAQVGDSCDGATCSPELVCRDYGEGLLCYEQLPFCEM